MFVFVKVRDAILNEDKDSVLSPDKRRLPLAVAKVLAWNSDRLEVPAQHGFKKAYAFIQVRIPWKFSCLFESVNVKRQSVYLLPRTVWVYMRRLNIILHFPIHSRSLKCCLCLPYLKQIWPGR